MADSGSNAAGLLIQEGNAERACALCYLVSQRGVACHPHTPSGLSRNTPSVENHFDNAFQPRGRPRSLSLMLTSPLVRPGAFSQALNGDPDCAAALYNLNTALRMLGRTREAVAFSWRWIRDRLAPGTAVDRFVGSAAPDVAAGEEGGGRARLLTVACVRWGHKYGPEYVEHLAAGVRRHLTRRHRFVCFTDDVEALRGVSGVVAKPLGTGGAEWRGWWHKAFLFSR